MKTAVFWEVTPCKLVNRYKRTAAIFMAKVSLTWKEVLNDGREQVLVVYFHTKCLQLRIYIYIHRVILSVLNPGKCECLKDYSLDLEHACMTTYLAS